MLSVRPKIAELVLQMYGRALHPELFEVYGTKRIVRGRVARDTHGTAPDPEASGYEAIIQVTSAGHVVTWRHAGMTLTEVAASSHQPLPQKRRLMSHRLEGEQSDRIECRGGVTYEVGFALDTVTPEAFQALQREIDLMNLQGGDADGESGDIASGLLHRFDASTRVGHGLGAVSYVNVQSRDRSLRVRAMHTFPDDHAIVKTESVFRLPGK